MAYKREEEFLQSPQAYRTLNLIFDAQEAWVTMSGDAHLEQTLRQNLRGTGGPFALEQECQVWRKGRGFSEEGRIAGQVGGDVVLLHGNRLIHAHAQRVRRKFPAVQAMRLPGDDFAKTFQVLKKLRGPVKGPRQEFPPGEEPKEGEDDDDGDDDDDAPGPGGPWPTEDDPGQGGQDQEHGRCYDPDDPGAAWPDQAVDNLMRTMARLVGPGSSDGVDMEGDAGGELQPPAEDDGAPSSVHEVPRADEVPLPDDAPYPGDSDNADGEPARSAMATGSSSKEEQLKTWSRVDRNATGFRTTMPKRADPEAPAWPTVVCRTTVGLNAKRILENEAPMVWLTYEETHRRFDRPRGVKATSCYVPVSTGVPGYVRIEKWNGTQMAFITEVLEGCLKDEVEGCGRWAYWVNRHVGGQGFVTKAGLRAIIVPLWLAKGPGWDESRRLEIQSWKQSNTHRTVKIDDYPELPIYDYPFAYTRKPGGRGKSWPTFRGDGDQGVKYEEQTNTVTAKEMPTVKKESVRLYHAINAEMQWQEWQGDVPTAFLQSDEDPNRPTILMEAPEPVPQGHCWLLPKHTYGENDAPLAWYCSFRGDMCKRDGKALTRDRRVFVIFRWMQVECVLQGHFVLHVDDFGAAGAAWFVQEVLVPVCIRYGVKDLRHTKDVPCGITQEQGPGTSVITLSQEEHATSIAPVKKTRVAPAGTPRMKEENHEVHRVSGEGLWLLVSYMAEMDDVTALECAQKLVKAAREGANLNIQYAQLVGGNVNNLELLAIWDSGFQTVRGSKS